MSIPEAASVAAAAGVAVASAPAAKPAAAATSSPFHIGVLLGSARVGPNNTAGLLAWIRLHFSRVLTSLPASHPFAPAGGVAPELVVLAPAAGPLGPVTAAVMPCTQADPTRPFYVSAATQAWSDQVRQCQALIILTPQFNWSVPGELKNSLDHLYWEWRGRACSFVTFGGHGGARCAEHLRQICEGALHMHVLPVARDIRITMPHEFIQGEHRVDPAWFTPPSSATGPAAAVDGSVQKAGAGQEKENEKEKGKKEEDHTAAKVSPPEAAAFLLAYDEALETTLRALLEAVLHPTPAVAVEHPQHPQH